jgi:hypothetical protein
VGIEGLFEVLAEESLEKDGPLESPNLCPKLQHIQLVGLRFNTYFLGDIKRCLQLRRREEYTSELSISTKPCLATIKECSVKIAKGEIQVTDAIGLKLEEFISAFEGLYHRDPSQWFFLFIFLR